jgi:hypothetical protein
MGQFSSFARRAQAFPPRVFFILTLILILILILAIGEEEYEYEYESEKKVHACSSE